MGSPHEVIAPLKSLMEIPQITVVAAVSQPARPVGRKRKLTDPPVATFAKENKLKLFQPESAKEPSFLEELRKVEPNIIITAAYGQILNEEFLKIPTLGTVNLHPSMLPAYRGATPVQTALLNGDKTTGISVLYTVKQLDAGDIILQKPLAIHEDETAGALMHRLFEAYTSVFPEVLNRITSPLFKAKPQDVKKATHCAKISKNDGLVDWNEMATQIQNKYQALTPWPGIYSFVGKKRILFTKVTKDQTAPLEVTQDPGEFFYDKRKKALIVRCKDSYLSILKLKPAGSREVEAAAFWNGGKFLGKGKFDDAPKQD